MKDLPLIEVEELPACQWGARLGRAIDTPPKFERWWGDAHKTNPVYVHGCIVYEPQNVNLNLEF